MIEGDLFVLLLSKFELYRTQFRSLANLVLLAIAHNRIISFGSHKREIQHKLVVEHVKSFLKNSHVSLARLFKLLLHRGEEKRIVQRRLPVK